MSSDRRPVRQRLKKFLRIDPRSPVADSAHRRVPPVGYDAPKNEERTLDERATPAIDVKVADGVNDDKSPIWNQSVRRFARERPELYILMKDHIVTFGVQSVNNWDTWLNYPEKEPNDVWLRRCKAYLPSFKAVKGGAMAVSNLDPHGLARLITAGVFVAIELFFESVDPSSRDKAMSFMLKVKVFIDKWTDAEIDLQQLKDQVSESDQNLEKMEQIEKSLGVLYLGCLELISRIYKSGKTRHGRLGATLAFGPAEWDRLYQKLNDKDTECSDWKSLIEMEVKRNEANMAILDKIRDRSMDPEPGHQSIMETTGITDVNSTAGNWFLETEEFTSWLGGIRHGEATSQVFWLKGSMGTGKTTLMCRILSHFKHQPLQGVRFVPYYCYASGTSHEPKAPTYETIVRALCRRLAWNGNGSVVERARQVFNTKRNADASYTVKSTWGPLLQDLVASNNATIIFAIDALDECDEMDQYNQFLLFLGDLLKGQKGVYCIISTRPYVQVGG
ncbi:hypothetical protein F5Y08DRAFT_312964 [Xylaria arbuscula]|nr:hypothetical protein F5Y08DRAFT_312964 [Xylaria arbuscula]